MPELKKNIATPEGTLIWSYVFRPDTESKYADGKYKQSFRVHGDAADQLKADLDELASKAAKELGADKIDNELYRPAKDKDKKEIPGVIEVKFKTKTAPLVIDGKKNRISKSHVPGYKDNCQLGTGVVVYSAVPLSVSGKNYLTLYLQAVQIKELSTGNVDLNMFEEYDDGFVAENDEQDTHLNIGDEDDLPDFASK